MEMSWMMIVLCVFTMACASDDEPARGRSHKELTILDGDGQPVWKVRAEVVASPMKRERGLMHRKELPDDQGMLFVFERETKRSFWMKNTLIPLDMLFLNSEGVVVGIVHEAEPQTETSRSVGVPSRFVLEVPGGLCRRKGIHRGHRVVLPF